MLGFEVDDLSADHAVDGAGGVGNFTDDGDAGLGGAAELREHLIGLRLQSVAGEDGDGLAECLVAGGTAAAQVIVIERGQIIVNQRIGVEHFEGGAETFDTGGKGSDVGEGLGGIAGTARHRRGARCARQRYSRDHAARFHAENGAQAFAAGEHAVAHGLMNGRGMLGCGRQKPFERGIGGGAALLQNLFQHGKEV